MRFYKKGDKISRQTFLWSSMLVFLSGTFAVDLLNTVLHHFFGIPASDLVIRSSFIPLAIIGIILGLLSILIKPRWEGGDND